MNDQPHPARGLAVGALAVFVTLATLALVALAVVWWNGGAGTWVGRQRCVADVNGNRVELSPDQAAHAATIAATAYRRQLPDRAVTVALAAAYQESNLHNLPHGDRDSAGLFQQRPSQGWGTFAQVTNPSYAAGRFFDALLAIPGWQQMAVTRAAQAVQRSAFPQAYQQHASQAHTLAAVLMGRVQAAFTCTVQASNTSAPQAGADALTKRARVVRQSVDAAFGPQSWAASSGVGHAGTSAHKSGHALDLFPGPFTRASQRRAGWAAASWLVANASQLHVSVVIYDDHIWSARRSPEGWRRYVSPSSNSTIKRHLDHIHVEVAA